MSTTLKLAAVAGVPSGRGNHSAKALPRATANESETQKFEVKVAQVKQLHAAVMAHRHDAREKALDIGEVLTGIKGLLKHKEWLPWLATNLPEITKRTAQNYMRLWKNRDLVKNETGAFLVENYTAGLAAVANMKKAEPEAVQPPAKGAAERSRKRELLGKLGPAFIAGLETEDVAVLELLTTRLPEWRTGLLEAIRREIDSAPSSAPNPELLQLIP